MLYAFITGRNPELSFAELSAFFGLSKIRAAGGVHEKKLILFEEPLPDEPQKFLNRLGGCTEILEIVKSQIPVAKLEEELISILLKKAERKSGKLKFSLDELPVKNSSRLLKVLLSEVKKGLRTAGVSAAFLNKGPHNVSPVAAAAKGLIKSGTKLCIIDEGQGRCGIGVSVALQDIDEYAARDYGKPFRDARAGMLPPKLAQIMINVGVAHGAPRVVVLDPFCGSGSILMEAMLMGFSVIGSDIDARMVEGAQKNVDWLRKKFNIPEAVTSTIFQKDARALSLDELGQPSALAVVTEPFLGPPLLQAPAPEYIKKIIAQLAPLYNEFLSHCHFKVTVALPVWKDQKAQTHPLADHLHLSEFHMTADLHYHRPDQVVQRQIVVLEPVKR